MMDKKINKRRRKRKIKKIKRKRKNSKMIINHNKILNNQIKCKKQPNKLKIRTK